MTDSSLSIAVFDPADLDLPSSKFPTFRRGQIECIDWVVSSPKRFMGACLPTGAGKTLIPMAIAAATGWRTAILTRTKALQEQYVDDFGARVFKIMGKGNYRCEDKGTTCKYGPHEGCRFEGPACAYEFAKGQAKQAPVVLPNYAYWIRVNERGQCLQTVRKDPLTGEERVENPFEFLVLDEGHEAMEELAQALQVSIGEDVLRLAGIVPEKTGGVRVLAAWAAVNVNKAQAELNDHVGRLRQARTSEARWGLRESVVKLEGLVEGLSKVSQMDGKYWVAEMEVGTAVGRRWVFDCVWPGGLAENRLFFGIPKVLAMSATLRPQSLWSLGIKKEEMAFREWPRVFPAQNTQVVAWPTLTDRVSPKTGQRVAVGMNFRTSEEDWGRVIEDVDAFIDEWQGVKGLIHTGSYQRQKMMKERSRWAGSMVFNDQREGSRGALEAAEEWKAAEAPKILVSPSFSTGWNFPGGGWIIFLKVPLKPSQSKIIQERLKVMPNYLDNLAMQELVQGCGRLSRTERDRTMVVIKDANVFWFLNRNKSLKPGFFDVRGVTEMPRLRGVWRELADGNSGSAASK